MATTATASEIVKEMEDRLDKAHYIYSSDELMIKAAELVIYVLRPIAHKLSRDEISAAACSFEPIELLDSEDEARAHDMVLEAFGFDTKEVSVNRAN